MRGPGGPDLTLRRAGVVAGALAALLCAAPAAHAAFPGLNGLIAFERAGQVTVKNPGDVSSATPLTAAGSNEDPAWSPDGTRIAFVSNRAGPFDVYVMDADGSDQTRITFEAVDAHHPAWSPDGTRIAFDGNNVSQDIVVVNANGSGRTVVAGGDNIQNSPEWTADGARIVFRDFSQGTGLSSVAADGSGRAPFIAQAAAPNLSPDGGRVVFERSGQLAVAGIDGSGAVPITSGGGVQPAYSPDGAQVVYSRFETTHFELFTVGSAGGAQIQETLTGGGVQNTDPDWQPIGPPPDISALSRPVAGSPGATLTVDGSGFVLRSVVRWNGVDRPTTLVGPTRLTAVLSAADVASPGSAQVTVFTPPTGGGLSLPRTAVIDPPPRITLGSATISARWTRSRVRGSLRLRGAAERAGRVEIALLRGGRVLQRRTARVPAGAFTRSVRLKRTLLPGALRVRVREIGPVTGARLSAAARTVRLRPPREGVVSRAFVSALQRGPSARSLRAPRRVFAHFRFAARPARGLPLSAAWTRGGRPVGGAARKAFAGTVIAFVGAPGRLPSGLYRCTLRAGRRVVAVATVRLT